MRRPCQERGCSFGGAVVQLTTTTRQPRSRSRTRAQQFRWRRPVDGGGKKVTIEVVHSLPLQFRWRRPFDGGGAAATIEGAAITIDVIFWVWSWANHISN